MVILTTSKAEEDISRSYDMGANSYITKPVNFEDLLRIVASMKKYWLEDRGLAGRITRRAELGPPEERL